MTAVPALDVCETNLSQLFFTPDRVYKLLKPVATPFVDFSETNDRLDAAKVEFECNRRISPDVYLGLVDLAEDDVVTDRMIIMRRLPAAGELTRLLGQGDPEPMIRSVARYLAGFHCSLDPIHDERADVASADAVAKNWGDNLTTLEAFVDGLLDRDEFEEVASLQKAYIEGRRPLFEERKRLGWIRDGHGDLRGEHLYRTEDGWRLIDCVAFRDDLRISDVLADIAFLVMDLHRLVGPQAAVTLMRAWDEFTNEHHPSSLAHFYVAYRAHVRCKVACLRYADGHEDAGEAARRYHDLALQHLRLAQVRLVLVGGGAGTGKSTVSQGVAERIGAVWVRSDEVRKDIAGIGHDEHAFAPPGEGIYSAEMSAKVADELARQAELMVSHGMSVVLDATWADGSARERIRAMAETTSTSMTELRCVVDNAVAKERIARRQASVYNPSDATADVVDFLLDRFEPWPEAHELCTAESIGTTIETAAGLIGHAATPSTAARRFRLAIMAASFAPSTTGFSLPDP